MTLARTLEMLKRGERINDALYRQTTRAPRRPEQREPDRAPDAWSRFLIATLAAHRPAGRRPSPATGALAGR